MTNNSDDFSTVVVNQPHSIKPPKNKNEIHSLEDIIADLRYLTIGFPEAAVENALNRQAEITPALLNFLDEIISHYESLDNLYFGHLHALYLLAKFREKEAYSRVIEIMSLPDEWPENILGDTITEHLHNIVASLYNGDLTSIYAIIENPKLNTWSRNAAMKTLLVLVKENVLERAEVILYFKSLFDHFAFKDDYMAITHLVNAACDLYPDDLQEYIQTAFNNGMVDESAVNMKWVKSILATSQETALEKSLHNGHYNYIDDDVIMGMKRWACFLERIKTNVACPKHGKIPYVWTSPKTGRNDPCPCNSGKKYKKCCLLIER